MSASKHPDLVGELIAWIDRVTRAIDAPPGSCIGINREAAAFRERLQILRDGIVLGSNLAKAERKLK